ncbi:hypothetical protein MMC10_005072 [Thelotrema lepadinum]|nr:hypothetical protein [Thelotrema lepadinum]
MSLHSKTALVTGGSKGIGASITAALVAAGAQVAISYSSDSAAAEAIVFKHGKDKILAVKSDAGKIADIEDLVKQTVDRFGGIDILIANAGILPMKTLEDTTEEDFERCMTTNVKGPYFLCQLSLPHLRPSARVLLLSTTLCAASTVTPNYLLYNTSKGAIEQMTRVMAKDLGRRGITVNAIAPGPTGTELFLKGKPEGVIKGIAAMNPFNRLGGPEEIAAAVMGVVGSGGGWINGQVLRVNGGMA